jgi:mannonate dehydratase
VKLASVLTPLSHENLTLAAQTGVDEIVARYPGPDLSVLDEVKARIESYGMRLGVVEGYLPIENIKLGRDDGTEMAQMKTLVRHLGEIGVPLICYNFMAGTDWIRTSVDSPERGGARVTAFDLADLASARIPGREPFRASLEPGAQRQELWTNLEAFLTEIIPVAEDAGVVLAMHPDDPPLPELLGNDRCMHSVEGFERLVSLVPSPSNAIAFCHQATRWAHRLRPFPRCDRHRGVVRGNVAGHRTDRHGRGDAGLPRCGLRWPDSAGSRSPDDRRG